ncbi:MAG: spore germination protein [Bacillota bacterium]
MDISKDLSENLTAIKEEVDGSKTFDLVNRDFQIAEIDVSLIFIDSFAKGELLNEILEFLMKTKREELSVDVIKKLLNNRLPLLEVSVIDKIEDLLAEVLAGPQVLLIDGLDQAIVLDARTWMSRSPEEPELEKATRGPEDGFIETMVFNLQMIRRRIRDPKLRAEVIKVGRRSQTDTCVTYIKDVADNKLVEDIKDRLNQIEIDGLPLADRTIEDYLIGDRLNPLPKVRYTNRPDIASSHLLEGKICIIVDNSPTVLILPATLFDHTQNLEDYRQPPIPGTYMNLLRFCSILISLFLPAVWLLLAYHPNWLPEALQIIGPREVGSIPLGIQFILASIGIDLIRIASIQTPSSLATSLGLIGALMLGEFSVKVGLFAPEVILYMAIAAISSFTIPGFEFALTIKLFRLVLITLVVLFKGLGLLVGTVAIFLVFSLSKSFGVSYLWPLIPFDWKALKTYLIRQSTVSLNSRRSNLHNLKDETRK